MYSLEELEKQNREIADLCQILAVVIQDSALRGNLFVCDLVSRFYDKVWLHLMFEDKSLYIDLLNHSNPEVVENVKNFHDSAKSIKKRFGSHIKQWCHIQTDEVQHQAFQEQMQTVIDDVRERVNIENEQIIPMVKQLHQEKMSADS